MHKRRETDSVALFAQHGWEADIKQPAGEGAKYNPQRFRNMPGQSMMSFFARGAAKSRVTSTGYRDSP